MKPKEVFTKCINKLFHDVFRSSAKYNSPGSIIKSLPDDERNALHNLKSHDIEEPRKEDVYIYCDSYHIKEKESMEKINFDKKLKL